MARTGLAIGWGLASTLLLASASWARPDETRFTAKINTMIDAFWAEHSICRGFPGGGSLSNAGCARRDQISAYLEKRHYCFDSPSKIAADDNWLWCGKGRAPRD